MLLTPYHLQLPVLPCGFSLLPSVIENLTGRTPRFTHLCASLRSFINAIIRIYRNDDIRMYKFHYISDTICMRRYNMQYVLNRNESITVNPVLDLPILKQVFEKKDSIIFLWGTAKAKVILFFLKIKKVFYPPCSLKYSIILSNFSYSKLRLSLSQINVI